MSDDSTSQRRLFERPNRKPLPERVGPEVLIEPEHVVAKIMGSDEVVSSIETPEDRKATFFSLKTNPLGSRYQSWIHGRFPVAPKKRLSGEQLQSVTLNRGELLDVDFYLSFPKFLRAVERYIAALRSPEIKAKWQHLMLGLIVGVKPSKEEVERWTREAALRKAAESKAKRKRARR